MALINVKEDDSVREATLNENERTAQRDFTVLFDSASDGPIAARDATGVPEYADAHPDDSDIIVLSKRAKNVGNSRVFFRVEIRYGLPGSDPFSGPNDDPLLAPTARRWSTVKSEEPIDQDFDGNPIVTASDEPFDPPSTTVTSDPLLTISRNEVAPFDPDIIDTYVDKTNSSTFYGAPAGEAHMVDIFSDDVYVGGVLSHVRVTYQIQFRRYHPNTTAANAWYSRRLNEGFRTKATVSGMTTYQEIVIEDEDGIKRQLSNPMPLTADGTDTVPAASANWLEFKRFTSVNFTPLALEF
jgi:hypothetical protein